MADSEVIKQFETILQNLEDKVGKSFSNKTLPRIICALESYNKFCLNFSKHTFLYPYDAYYYANKGMIGILHNFYSKKHRNYPYKAGEHASRDAKEHCLNALADFACLNDCREYYYTSDITISDKKIIIKPFVTNELEILDYNRDSNYYIKKGLNPKNKRVFASIKSSRYDLFFALKSFYKKPILDAGIKPDAKIGGILYCSFITAIFYFITINYEFTNYIIDKCFNCKFIKIINIYDLKKDLLQYINNYQKHFYADAQNITRKDVDTIYNVLSVNFDNYKIALSKGHIDRLFIQLNNDYCTFVTRYSPTEHTEAFQFLNRLLCAYFLKDYNRCRDERENLMFSKLTNYLLLEKNLQIKQGIKLRDNNRILTDIDALIYDNIGNTAYFVQFKYQDDFVNDIKAKRSQVKHLEEQINKWFDAINEWEKTHILELFLKNSNFKNIKEKPNLKYIIFTQYNINQLLTKNLKENTIYVSSSMFYQKYVKLKNLNKTFSKIYKLNRKPIEETPHFNERFHIMDYEFYYDFSSSITRDINNQWHTSNNIFSMNIADFF